MFQVCKVVLPLLLLHLCATPSQAQVGNFKDQFSKLALETRHTILLEGAPLFEVPENSVKKLFSSSNSTKYKVKLLSELYDYTPQLVGDTFFLQKQYTSPYDLPCVTWEEMESFARDAAKIMRSAQGTVGGQGNKPLVDVHVGNWRNDGRNSEKTT